MIDTERYDNAGPDDAARLAQAFLKVLVGIRNDRLWLWSPALQGFTTLDLHVLLMVEQKPDLILKEIRDRLELPNSTLTSVIDRLEKRAVVERTINHRDHRSYGLRLTDHGREIRAEHERVYHLMMERLLECLPLDADHAAFVEKMVKIGDRLELRTAAELGLVPRRPTPRTRRHESKSKGEPGPSPPI